MGAVLRSSSRPTHPTNRKPGSPAAVNAGSLADKLRRKATAQPGRTFPELRTDRPPARHTSTRTGSGCGGVALFGDRTGRWQGDFQPDHQRTSSWSSCTSQTLVVHSRSFLKPSSACYRLILYFEYYIKAE